MDQTTQMMLDFEHNKKLIKELQDKNKEIAAYLTSCASFKPGSKTGYALGAEGIKAKVVTGETITWDQGKLELARVEIGNAAFFRAFEPEFKPRSKAYLEEALADNTLRPSIIAAMTKKPKTPSVEIVREEK